MTRSQKWQILAFETDLILVISSAFPTVPITLLADMNSTLSTSLALFRVQYERSFTYYEPNNGFEANAFYWMDPSHWFNPSNVRKHLDWNDRSSESSPFISLFDNLGKKTFKDAQYTTSELSDVLADA